MTYVYVGGHTRSKPFADDPRPGRGTGISVYRLEERDGSLLPVQTVALEPDPTYLHVSPSGGTLYAAIHSSIHLGQPGSALVSFSIDPGTGALTRLNHRAIPSPHAAHVGLDRSERFALVSSSVGGGLSVVAIEAGRGLGPLTDEIRHAGALMPAGVAAPFPAAIRRGPPFPHCMLPDLANRFILVADLGRNRVDVHPFDAVRGTLGRSARSFELHAGAGPRALAMHPAGAIVYAMNEDDCSVSVLGYTPATGMLEEVQQVGTLPHGAAGRSTGGAVAVHPSGRLLLTTTRGSDSIAMFAIDAGGTPEMVASLPAAGAHPRHLALTPLGDMALVANTNSDGVTAFRIDLPGARMTPAGVTSVPTPTCVAFYDPAARARSSISGT